ncbi:hypothetical protein EPN83_02085 [Patescibacteria group bacterium]|nr:MAG: hypothetical protein EPN83_02085 [Patescibacteria group bacterium]
MADLRSILGVIAGVITFLAFVPYIISTVKGDTKPERATWFIWAVVGFLLLTSYHYSGAVSTIWAAVTYFIGPLIVALISVKYGVGGWSVLDKVCLSGAAVSLILWYVTKSAPVALYINILVDFLGLIPTIVKTYNNPSSESRLSWSMSTIGNFVNLLAINRLTLSIIIFPAYFLLNTGTILLLILFRGSRKFKNVYAK